MSATKAPTPLVVPSAGKQLPHCGGNKDGGEHMLVSNTPTIPLIYYYDLFCTGEPEVLIYLLLAVPEGSYAG